MSELQLAPVDDTFSADDPSEAASHDLTPREAPVATAKWPSDFFYSNAKSIALRECDRRFFLRYRLGRDGWREDASAEAREAYRLGKLTTLAMQLGQSVHRRAAECVRALQCGEPLPPLAMLVRRTRDELNELYLSSRNTVGFERAPNRVPMLAELYQTGAAKLSPRDIARTTETLYVCLTNLANSPIWDVLREVRDVQRDIILVDPDRPEKFSLQGRTAFAKPDLIYAPGDRPEGAWTVLDWKTTNSENAGELDQVAVYALYAILGRKLTFVDGGCDARIVNLARGTIETLPLDSDLLADTIERLRAEMEAMRRAEIDLETGRVLPLDPALYPQTERRSKCRYCSYRGLCGRAESERPARLLQLARRTA